MGDVTEEQLEALIEKVKTASDCASAWMSRDDALYILEELRRLRGVVGRIRRETAMYQMPSSDQNAVHMDQVTRIRRIADEAFTPAKEPRNA